MTTTTAPTDTATSCPTWCTGHELDDAGRILTHQRSLVDWLGTRIALEQPTDLGADVSPWHPIAGHPCAALLITRVADSVQLRGLAARLVEAAELLDEAGQA